MVMGGQGYGILSDTRRYLIKWHHARTGAARGDATDTWTVSLDIPFDSSFHGYADPYFVLFIELAYNASSVLWARLQLF